MSLFYNAPLINGTAAGTSTASSARESFLIGMAAPFVSGGVNTKINNFSVIKENQGGKFDTVNSKLVATTSESWLLGWNYTNAYIVNMRVSTFINGVLVVPIQNLMTTPGVYAPFVVVLGAGDYVEYFAAAAGTVDQMSIWGTRVA